MVGESHFIGLPIFFHDVNVKDPKALYDTFVKVRKHLGSRADDKGKDLSAVEEGDLSQAKSHYEILRRNLEDLQHRYRLLLDIEPNQQCEEALSYIDNNVYSIREELARRREDEWVVNRRGGRELR